MFLAAVGSRSPTLENAWDKQEGSQPQSTPVKPLNIEQTNRKRKHLPCTLNIPPHISFSLRVHAKVLDHREGKAEGYDVQGNIQYGSRCDESAVIEIVGWEG